MIQYKKLMMTLALLLSAATGAWADGTVTVTEIKASEMPTSWESNGNPVKATDLPGFTAVTRDEAKALGAPAAEGDIFVCYAISNNNFIGLCWNNGVLNDNDGEFSLGAIYALKDVIKFYYTGSAEAPITVEPVEGKTNQWTFSMPGSDVVLTPIYAKTAAFATTGSGSEMTTLLPAAAEGVIAGTDASLIAEGTGIVAFAGTSTTVTQGTVWYAIGTSDTTAPDLDAADTWSTDVPTAENVGDDGGNVYVWYYIVGADAPDGVDATLDNTFDNTEPACLTVPVLSNKFDLTLKAANANTIDATQASKGTVTVNGTDKTEDISNGQLKAIKMGSEVKLNAAQGYKFRKVEVKKKAAAPATPEGPTLAQTLTTANMTVKVYYIYTDMNNTCEFLSNGDGTYTFQSGTGLVGGNSQKAKALVVENGKLVFKQNFFETIDKLWNQVGFSVTFDTSENTYSIWKGSNETINATLSKVEVNGTQIALTQQ